MHDLFTRLARSASTVVAHPLAFVAAVLAVLIWAAAGPALHYSENWQLVINTGTTILTFLMVFLLQNMQNRDSRAMQVKLDELIRVSNAHNSFVGIEHLTDEELQDIRNKCELRAKSEEAGITAVKETGKKARQAADRASA